MRWQVGVRPTTQVFLKKWLAGWLAAGAGARLRAVAAVEGMCIDRVVGDKSY